MLPFLACVCLSVWTGCSDSDLPFSYEAPPAGVPDTPYWFPIRDTLFWYRPDDSVSLVQMHAAMSKADKSAALQSVRKLGWRMTVERTRALLHPQEAQELSQSLFAVERVEDAVTPVTQHGRFRRVFWKGTDTTLLGWLPGLRASGRETVQYYWPSAVGVVWKPGMRAIEADHLIDSLGFQVVTPSSLTQNYWVERAWAVMLPAGADLFTWLRWFNRDPRVHVAHPILAVRDPPMPDQRILRRFVPVPDSLEPAAFDKLTPPLRKAWEISQFCGHTGFVVENTLVQTDGQRLRVRITLASGSREAAAEIIQQAGGELIESRPLEVEAWIPYQGMPVCAADLRVQKLEEVKANVLED